MIKFFKNIKTSIFLTSILEIALGALVFLTPLTLDKFLVYGGYGLIIIGIINILFYFFQTIENRFKRNDFANGAILAVLGGALLLYTDDLADLANLIFGICIIIDGIFKLQDALDVFSIRRTGALQFALAIFTILGGVFILYDPLKDNQLNFYIIAGLLLYCGISDIISTLVLAAYMASYDSEKKPAVSSETIDVSDLEPKQPDEIIIEDEEKDK